MKDKEDLPSQKPLDKTQSILISEDDAPLVFFDDQRLKTNSTLETKGR
jgi:hypothetical protein